LSGFISNIICLINVLSFTKKRPLFESTEHYTTVFWTKDLFTIFIIFNTVSFVQHILSFHTLIFNCFSHSFNNLQSHFFGHHLVYFYHFDSTFFRLQTKNQFNSFHLFLISVHVISYEPCYILPNSLWS